MRFCRKENVVDRKRTTDRQRRHNPVPLWKSRPDPVPSRGINGTGRDRDAAATRKHGLFKTFKFCGYTHTLYAMGAKHEHYYVCMTVLIYGCTSVCLCSRNMYGFAALRVCDCMDEVISKCKAVWLYGFTYVLQLDLNTINRFSKPIWNRYRKLSVSWSLLPA